MVVTTKRILTFEVESKLGKVEAVVVQHMLSGHYTIRGLVEDFQFSASAKELADALYKFHLKVEKL
jgi:hypothetical protein